MILPFRDAQRFLPAAIASIQSQVLADFEIIAVDDGSSDGSSAVVKAAAARDHRVQLVDTGRRGLPGALNEGCRLARGRYLARMDADDIAMPTRLARQVAALDASPELVVVGGAVDLIDEQDSTVGEIWYAGSDAAARLVLANGGTPFCHPATTIRRTAFDAAGGYRAECELAEDLDLWLRLAGIGRLLNLDAKVLRYRLHPASASYDRIRTQIASQYRALLLNDAGRSHDERRRALTASDAWTLIQSWAPPGSAAGASCRQHVVVRGVGGDRRVRRHGGRPDRHHRHAGTIAGGPGVHRLAAVAERDGGRDRGGPSATPRRRTCRGVKPCCGRPA